MEEKNYKSRGEMVGETLKQEILDLRLKPGQMISENDVCDRFGVSRTPVREALRLLQEQGFVETVPYRGTYVTLLSLDNIKQMSTCAWPWRPWCCGILSRCSPPW